MYPSLSGSNASTLFCGRPSALVKLRKALHSSVVAGCIRAATGAAADALAVNSKQSHPHRNMRTRSSDASGSQCA
jgi:hypothetical protein